MQGEKKSRILVGGNTGHLKMVPANPSLAERSDIDKLEADRVVKRSRTA